MRTSLLLTLALSACNPWNLPHDGNLQLGGPLWDASRVVPTESGLYVPLPASGGLALVATDGTATRVAIEPGRVTRLAAAPDDRRVVAFVDRYRCLTDDRREARRVKFVSDCPPADLETRSEVVAIEDGEVITSVPVPSHFNGLAFSDDGAYAIAFLQFEAGMQISGVVDLTAVLVIDFEARVGSSVPVGFAADRVLFTPDGDRAVVLSQSRVAVVDLAAQPPRTEVTFPLTLDADQRVDPVGIALTPDGRYALISVQGKGDLYVLDLQDRAVNMVSLSSNPAAMDVNPLEDQTVLVYASRSAVDVLDHTFFDLDTIELDEPMNQILRGSDSNLLYNTHSGHDVYRLYPSTREIVEYRLQNPALSLHLAPTEEYAIALTRPESGFGDGIDGYYDARPGMEILDLRDDRGKSWPYLLEANGLGVAFNAEPGALHALVLQQGIRYVYQLDLYTGSSEQIDLSAPPNGVGAIPNGPFYITHDTSTGFVSFLDPATGEITEASGFGLLGLAEPVAFTPDGQE